MYVLVNDSAIAQVYFQTVPVLMGALPQEISKNCKDSLKKDIKQNKQPTIHKCSFHVY